QGRLRDPQRRVDGRASRAGGGGVGLDRDAAADRSIARSVTVGTTARTLFSVRSSTSGLRKGTSRTGGRAAAMTNERVRHQRHTTYAANGRSASAAAASAQLPTGRQPRRYAST